MKFVCFIASTLLIVLINQHSTMGLPVKDDTSVEKQCPEGMEYDKDGICTKVSPTWTVTEPMVVPEKIPERKVGACPEGMVHGAHGICQKMELTETTTVGKEDLDRKVNLNDCPKGTKKDEQGACQEIEPTDTKNKTTDPKMLLQKDGSCPENFKMVAGKCLYIKPKSKLPLYPLPPKSLKPKSGNAETIEYEKVPILADNSCPEGTEYREKGFCQRRISPSNSKFNVNADGKCPTDFELIDGKCTPKSSKEQDQSSEASTTSILPLPTETTTFAAEPKLEHKSKIETATVTELTNEFLPTTPSQP